MVSQNADLLRTITLRICWHLNRPPSRYWWWWWWWWWLLGTGSLVATHIVLKTWGGSNTCLDNAPAHFTIQFNLSVLNLYYLNLYLSVLYLCFFLVCEYSLPWSTQNTPCQFEDIKLLKSITPTLLKHRFRIEMRRIIAVLLNVHRNTEASHYYHHHTVCTVWFIQLMNIWSSIDPIEFPLHNNDHQHHHYSQNRDHAVWYAQCTVRAHIIHNHTTGGGVLFSSWCTF